MGLRSQFCYFRFQSYFVFQNHSLNFFPSVAEHSVYVRLFRYIIFSSFLNIFPASYLTQKKLRVQFVSWKQQDARCTCVSWVIIAFWYAYCKTCLPLIVYCLNELENLFQDWNQDAKEGVVAYGIILISVTFNIFIFCYIGEILSEQVTVTAEFIININFILRLIKKTVRSINS